MSVTAEELAALDLFEGLGPHELAAWAAVAEERWVQPGEDILGPGVPSLTFKLLLEGRLDGLLTVDGRLERDHQHVAPTWLGAILVLTGEMTGPVTIRAAEPSRLGIVGAEDFRRLLFEQPAVLQRVMRQFRPVISRIEGAELQREKLAALGTMSAGLAHELNNPAAAAKRAAAALADALDVLGGVIGRFVESGVERAEAERLVALQREAMATAASAESRDALETADAEDAIGEALERHGVADGWRLAEPLAAAGLDDAWLEQVAGLAGPATDAAVRWVAASIAARGLTEELRDSTSRMSDLVGAIKAYSYLDQDALQEVDVHDGLDNTLLILGHKLKPTEIEVVRHYDRSLGPICVYGSELNQVWTNLLDNAIDALGKRGRITIATGPWHADGGVTVSITDDGPGVPADEQRRIFDPFYTTKAVGAGTGLGLDTARRIVADRHDGDLRLQSRPGETRFTVRLPRAPRQAS